MSEPMPVATLPRPARKKLQGPRDQDDVFVQPADPHACAAGVGGIPVGELIGAGPRRPTEVFFDADQRQIRRLLDKIRMQAAKKTVEGHEKALAANRKLLILLGRLVPDA